MISKGLALKTGSGLATAAASGTSMYFVFDHYGNQSTKYDQGLIDYLENGGKIQFAVEYKENNASTTNFPNFSNGSTLLTAIVKIKITSTNPTKEGTLTDKNGAKPKDKGHKDYHLKLNGVSDWTWICEIEFNKDNGDTKEIADDYKNRLAKADGEKGFFDKLKENDDKNKDNKDLKIKFIRDCAKERKNNRAINGVNNLSSMDPTTNEIKSSKDFTLRVGDENNGEITSKLYPDNISDFDYWFPPIKKQ